MKTFNSTALLDQLQSDVREMILRVTQLRSADPGILLEQPAPGKWSITEVIEHLNSYTTFYLVAIEKSLETETPAKEFFKSGLIGNYFTKLMQPAADGKIKNKMKSPRAHRPPRLLDSVPVMNTFLKHQHYLLDLLEKAKSKDIGGIKTPITISRFIRLKTGDVFRFLIAHEQRHFVQIEHALTTMRSFRSGKYPATLPVM